MSWLLKEALPGRREEKGGDKGNSTDEDRERTSRERSGMLLNGHVFKVRLVRVQLQREAGPCMAQGVHGCQAKESEFCPIGNGGFGRLFTRRI